MEVARNILGGMMENTTKKSKKDPVLSPFIQAYKGKLIGSALVEIFSVLFGLVPYYVTARIINQLFQSTADKSLIALYVLIGFIGHICKIYLHNLSTIQSHHAAFAILSDMRRTMADKLTTVPMGYVLSRPSGTFKEVMMDIVEKMEKPFAHMIPELTGSLIAPISLFIYMLVLDWRMALISLITIPVGFFFFSLMMRGYQKRFDHYIASGKEMNAAVVEYVGGIEVIKSFNQSASSYKKYSKVMNEHRDSMLLWFKDTMLFANIGKVVLTSTLLLVLPFGAYFYMNGSLAMSDFFMCIVLSLGIIPPLMKAMEFTDSIAELNTYIQEIGDIIHAKDLVRPMTRAVIPHHQVQFHDVHFSYDESEVLHGVNLTIDEGEMTALVGPSGSGKTTIANLIAGFWDVSQGAVTLGGVDVREIPLPQLMEHMTYVTQENFLFDQTIKDNIRAGKKDATDQEVIEAAKKASIHDFIMSLPEGYDTMSGSKGSRLSGGEKQRIAIARAILKDAPIIILDEATAYTDPDNEEKIQASINSMVEGKTLIVIAHRLSTIVHAEKIVVVNEGKVESEGSHSSLLEKSELYQTMWSSHIGSKDEMVSGGVR